MADKLLIFMTAKGTSVRCPALYRRVPVPTVSCVNNRSHCDFYCDVETSRRGTKHFIICKYREKPSARSHSVFGYGKASTPKEMMVEKGENWKWLEEHLEGHSGELDDIARKLMEKARRSTQ